MYVLVFIYFKMLNLSVFIDGDFANQSRWNQSVAELGQRSGLPHQALVLWLQGIAYETVPKAIGNTDLNPIPSFPQLSSDVNVPRRAPDNTC